MSHTPLPRSGVAANYVGTLSGVVIPLLTTPIYLTQLGATNWGLLSFALTLVALLSFFEVGLTQSLSRDFALRLTVRDGNVRSLLRAAEGLYWVVSTVGALLLVLTAVPIVEQWLRVPADQQPSAVHCIWFAALTLLLQLPAAVYRTVLIAAGSFTYLNAIVTICALMRHGIGALLVTWHQSLDLLLGWHAAVALLEAAWRRLGARRIVSRTGEKQVKATTEIMSIRRGLAMSGAVLIAVLTLQLDRILLSYLAPIEILGYYNIAYAVANGALQVGAPLIVTSIPAFASASLNEARMRSLCIRLIKWITLLVILSSVLYLFGGNALLHLWLRDSTHASNVEPILDVLLVGSAFNLLYQVGYQRWLVLDRLRSVALVNGIGLCGSVLLTPTLVVRFGGSGAAVSWTLISVVGMASSLVFLFRRDRNSRDHSVGR